MRWSWILVAVSLATTGYAAENEAESLYREAEKNLRAARTVQVRVGVKAGDAEIQGALLLGEGDRMRMDCRGAAGAVTFQAPTLIGDGPKIVTVGRADSEKPFIVDTADSPKGSGGSLRGLRTRPGILVEFRAITAGRCRRMACRSKVSDFKFGDEEKIGGIETRVVEYTVAVEGTSATVWLGVIETTVPLKGTEKAAAKPWIDAKTNVPVELELRSAIDGTAFDFTQTFTLDGKLDAKLFDVPK